MQKKIAILFAQFGPYHHARVRALQDQSTVPVIPAQIAEATQTYAWTDHGELSAGLVTLGKGLYENASPWKIFLAGRRFFREQGITHALLPSYAPAPETSLLLAARSCGVRCIMMNESHAGTEQATGWRRWLKRRLVACFDAALVGGAPQKRHFTALGMNPKKIFTGYDAIDNEFFVREVDCVRQNPDGWRARLDLPQRYILSLGRMVEKKNLGCLVDAYAALRQRLGEDIPALVFVGSGDQESMLRERCARHGLNVIDSAPCDVSHPSSVRRPPSIQKSEIGGRRSEIGGQGAEIESPTTSQAPMTKHQAHGEAATQPQDQEPSTTNQEQETRNQERGEAAVHFYGFRQINENPVFYALAEVFILPSLWEEWGLVVNEAMASGLPVIVSEAVGSAEDLVSNGENGFTFDPMNPGQLANSLDRLASDSNLRKRMSRLSQERISQWGCDNFARNAIAAVAECEGK